MRKRSEITEMEIKEGNMRPTKKEKQTKKHCGK